MNKEEKRLFEGRRNVPSWVYCLIAASSFLEAEIKFLLIR